MAGADVLTVPGFVGGEELPGDDRFVDLDPSTGEPWAHVARLGATEVDRAVAAARDAFDGTVRRQSAETRSGLLLRLAALIRRDADRLAELESRDVGKPLRQATADVSVTARYFEFYAGVLRALHGDVLPPADAHRVAEAVRAGQVFVNTYGAAGGIELPFGGWKRSGYGREKGVEGLLGYTQTKTVVVGIQ